MKITHIKNAKAGMTCLPIVFPLNLSSNGHSDSCPVESGAGSDRERSLIEILLSTRSTTALNAERVTATSGTDSNQAPHHIVTAGQKKCNKTKSLGAVELVANRPLKLCPEQARQLGMQFEIEVGTSLFSACYL
jgi:hypothetical protein